MRDICAEHLSAAFDRLQTQRALAIWWKPGPPPGEFTQAKNSSILLRIAQRSQRLAEVLAIVATHRQFPAIGQLDRIVSMRQRAEFAQKLDVDDGAAMDSYKLFRIEFAFQFVHGGAQAVLGRSAMNPDIVRV